jgi:hypothetical protein
MSVNEISVDALNEYIDDIEIRNQDGKKKTLKTGIVAVVPTAQIESILGVVPTPQIEAIPVFSVDEAIKSLTDKKYKPPGKVMVHSCVMKATLQFDPIEVDLSHAEDEDEIHWIILEKMKSIIASSTDIKIPEMTDCYDGKFLISSWHCEEDEFDNMMIIESSND